MRRSLLLLLLVATGLRLWGVSFGLDLHDVSRTVLYNQVDERGMVQAELDGLLAGDLHPGDFLHRGAAGYYVLGALDAAVLAPLALAADGGWAAQRARLAVNPSLLFLVHRLAAVLAGVASVALMVRLCRRELGGRGGLLGGALLATAYLHVRESHFGTVDVLWGLLTLATLDQALLLVRDPRPGRYVRVGLLAGATAATKYFGALLVLHLLAAHLAARAARPASGGVARRAGGGARLAGSDAPPAGGGGVRPTAGARGMRPGLRELALGMLAVAAGFVVVSPYLFFAAGDLLAMVRWSVDNIGAEPSAGGLLGALAHHARWTLGAGLGEPVFALALAGGVLGWRAGGARRLLVLFALLLLPTLFLTGHHPVRFGVALAVMLVPLAALALDALLLRLAAWPRRPAVARAVCGAALALILLPSLLRSVAFDSLVGRPDTRLAMLDALAATGAPASEVLAFGLYGLPRVPPGEPPVFVDAYRNALRGDRAWLERLHGAPPRYLLHDLCAGIPEAAGWAQLQPLVAERYTEVLRLEPRPDPQAVPLPDPVAGSPGHMIPFGNPWAMTRPGSALVLYERTAP